MKKAENTHDNSPVLKALRLMTHLARHSESSSLAEISRALDLPKPTTHRLALMLSELGFVQKDPIDLRYSLGPVFEELALVALRNAAGSTARRLLMDELSSRLGVRTNLAVLKAGKLLYIEWVESASVLRVDLKPGTQIPVHCSASGKLLMAYAPEELRSTFLKLAPFAPYTKNTITTAKELERELALVRRRGFSEDREEFLAGVCCMAVPIRDRSDNVVAGLAVMAPEASFSLSAARKHLPDIQKCAEAISKQLGWKVSDREKNVALPPQPAETRGGPNKPSLNRLSRREPQRRKRGAGSGTEKSRWA